jgi:acylphosphatase
MDRERRIVNYAGNVQGVGFRWQATRAVEPFEVTGFVRNLPDGTVELVLEGSPDAVRGAIEGVEKALRRHIRDRTESISSATGEFAGFGIRR